jgi:hypothetical protein
MRSFSNLSHPDLRILWGSLHLFRIASETYPIQIPSSYNLPIIATLQGELQEREKVLQRINELINAIEQELPFSPEEQL